MSEMPSLPDVEVQPPAYAGPSREAVHADRRSHLSPHIGHMYREPLMLVSGNGQYVYDETGRRYLDAFGGVLTTSIGHANPRLLSAMAEQAGRIMHTSMHYLNPTVSAYARELAARFPDPLDTVILFNSGSEANDMAIMAARLFTGNYDVIGLRNAFHGTLSGIVPLIAHQSWRYPLPADPGISRAGWIYAYRGPWAHDEPGAGEHYAEQIATHIAEATPGRIAAFLAETIQGVGGVVEPPPEFLSAAATHVRQAGGLYIADEVQTGFGRTGDAYWGFEAHGVTPDIVTMAKGIGNGFPIGALVTRREIAEVLGQKMTYNTYGGSPLACAAGLAVLEEIDAASMVDNARACGTRLLERLDNLAGKQALIGDIRGRGLMIGVELVRDRTTKEPARAETDRALEALREMGCLVGRAGFAGNVLRITPPMCATLEDMDFIADCLEVALATASEGV